MTWTGVSSLSVSIESGIQSADIYANGLNQVGVVVSLTPTDENGNTIYDPIYWPDHVELIDYVDGVTKLNWDGDSGWCYTDKENKPYHHIPGAARLPSRTQSKGNGTQTFTFWVYCAPGVSQKSIAAKITTYSGNVITSAKDSHSGYHSAVTLNPRAAKVYGLDDVIWNSDPLTTMMQKNTNDVWNTGGENWYLSSKDYSNFPFVHFDVQNYDDEDGWDGFYGFKYYDDWFDSESDERKSDKHNSRPYLRSAYVWHREPHDAMYPGNGYSANANSANSKTGASAPIINCPNGNMWLDAAQVYTRPNPNNSLCFTRVGSTTGGNGWVCSQPNWLQSFGWCNAYVSPQITAYDWYGNSGTFWLDGSDIHDTLKLLSHKP
ncbi:hypothetical protein [Streptomyces violascens]|uniref:hypothetical protein n=1 Tax=Streptomyces violascens TaxID=67381 RepID=UPI003676A145